jgi:hypothetical protein
MKRKPKPEVPKLCGTCNQLRFTGPQIMLQERGSCIRDWASGRFKVGVCDEACAEWSERTKARIAGDKAAQERTQAVAREFNSRGKNRKANSR